MELTKRHPSTDKDESCNVDKVSMTLLNTLSSVCLLKKPSHAKEVPQAIAARRSSQPRIVVTPGHDGQREILSYVRVSVDQVVTLTEFH
jgi:hypothetical protein